MNRWKLSCTAAAAWLLASAGAAVAQNTNPTGACCGRDAAGAVTCTVGTASACFGAHGFFRGPNTVCDPNPCVPPPPPSGACCTRSADGTTACAVQTLEACGRAHGAFRGANSTCDPNPCVPPPPPSGACCTRSDAGAVCAVQTLTACGQAHGAFRGANSTCDPNPCVPPPPPVRGACCVTVSHDGNSRTACVVTTEAGCTAAHGAYSGNNTTCSPTSCGQTPPPARGACCIAATETAGAHCTIGTEAACTTASGTYGGNNSTCASAHCATSCACDWDHDGSLSVRDLFAFIHAWVGGDADFNSSGATDAADLHAFIDCFSAPPAGCTRANGPG
jgi:hypothetical protein